MAIRQNLKLFNYISALLEGNTASLPVQINQRTKPTWTSDHPPTLLPRSTPEEQNVSTAHLAEFYEKMGEKDVINPHVMIVLRNGVVIGEAGYAPYTPEIWQITYSMCKSITSMAVGLAIEEDFFHLEDPIVKYFPEYSGMFMSRRTKSITIRHLLTMSSGVTFREPGSLISGDWEKSFFDSDVAFEPGTAFDYNSMNSYILSCLIQKTSGKSLSEYLDAKLFKPLGMGSLFWEKSPTGVDKGGWGLYMLPEDLAKLGQLLLQRGHWIVEGEDKKLIPTSWVDQMLAPAMKETNKEGQYYGLHIWVDPIRDGYYFSGLFGQRVYIDPKTDSVIVLTAGNPSLLVGEDSNNLFHWYLQSLPDKPLPTSPEEEDKNQADLQAFLDTLVFLETPTSFPLPSPPEPPKESFFQRLFSRFKKQYPPAPPPVYVLPEEAEALVGKDYAFSKNNAGILPIVTQTVDGNYTKGLSSISFQKESEDILLLLWKEGAATVSIPLRFHDAPLPSSMVIGGEHFETAASAVFAKDEDDHTVLKIRFCLLELSNSREIKIFFLENDTVRISMKENPEIVPALEEGFSQMNVLNKIPFVGHSEEYTTYLVHRLGWPSVSGTLMAPKKPVNLSGTTSLIDSLLPADLPATNESLPNSEN